MPGRTTPHLSEALSTYLALRATHAQEDLAQSQQQLSDTRDEVARAQTTISDDADRLDACLAVSQAALPLLDSAENIGNAAKADSRADFLHATKVDGATSTT